MTRKTTPSAIIEATVSSKGQITLPRTLRAHLGIHTGSGIRFNLLPNGGFEGHPILCELEDLWAAADQANKPGAVMTSEKMNRAKTRYFTRTKRKIATASAKMKP